MKNKGLLIVLSGPSGSGKDTVLSNLLEKNKDIKISISATTRCPRYGEVDGKDYYFISKQEFLDTVSQNGMLEHAEYCGNYYGTPCEQVENWLCKGNDVVLEIETKGAAQVMEKCPDAVSIFIVPPSLKELETRLRNRATDSNDVIDKRLNIAKNEIKAAENYNYIVVNEAIGQCADDICNIIISEKMRTHRKLDVIKEVLKGE